jgi:transcriptional regulator with XRE-family HTH domain
MTNAQSIDLDLSNKLKDREYRKDFFWAQAAAEIAGQLVNLRKRRDLNQKQVADMIGTKQPAISRAEQADYENWNLNTIRMIADALDARVRVLIEPFEDILSEYEESNTEENSDVVASATDVKGYAEYLRKLLTRLADRIEVLSDKPRVDGGVPDWTFGFDIAHGDDETVYCLVKSKPEYERPEYRRITQEQYEAWVNERGLEIAPPKPALTAADFAIWLVEEMDQYGEIPWLVEDGRWLTFAQAILSRLTEAASPASDLTTPYAPILIRFDDPPRLEYITEDAPSVYERIDNNFDIILAMNSRAVIGFRYMLPTPSPLKEEG